MELPSYPQPSGYEPLQLSTFQPTRNLNFFELSSDELSAMGIQNEASVLSINQEETLALLGAYALTILRGSVSILGMTLSASKVAYHVFAPRSAPIPILRCVASEMHADPNIHPFPSRVRDLQGDAVVAIQSLDTGVEGLGRVCRVFNGVFEPSRWQLSSAQVIRPGVSLVCMQFLYVQGGVMNENLQVTHSTRDVQPFVLPASWSTALNAVNTSPSSEDPTPLSVYVIKGPKKSGKSTFARTLLNRLLAR